jgi:hypothetical protein
MRKVAFVLACVGLLATACSSGGDAASDSTAGAEKTGGGEKLDSNLAKWSATSQCGDYDYFPNGGIQNFWCHRPAGVEVSALQTLAGVNIFVSGPHDAKANTLNLKSDDFGHYNPVFVQWLFNNGVSAHGSVVQKATQGAYNTNLRPLAEVFWKTYQKINADRACFDRETANYKAAIASHKSAGFIERYFYFMNPQFCKHGYGSDTYSAADDTFYEANGMDGGVDGNVAKTVVGFWMRRSMDGTMAAFGQGLQQLIAAYEPELLPAAH